VLDRTDAPTVEVASMMKKSAAMLEIGRDVVVLVGGIALVLVTPWLNTKGDQEVTGALLIYGLVLAGTALWAMAGASRPSHWVHLVVGILVLISPGSVLPIWSPLSWESPQRSPVCWEFSRYAAPASRRRRRRSSEGPTSPGEVAQSLTPVRTKNS